MDASGVLEQVFPIYLVTLTIVLMFLLDPFFVIELLPSVSVPEIQYKITIWCSSLIYR